MTFESTSTGFDLWSQGTDKSTVLENAINPPRDITSYSMLLSPYDADNLPSLEELNSDLDETNLSFPAYFGNVNINYNIYAALVRREIFSRSSIASEPTAIQRMNHYILKLKNENEIDSYTADIGWKCWNLIKQACPLLPVPDAASGPDKQLMYVWNNNQHHLELEIFPYRKPEIFYKNRITNELWSAFFQFGHALDEDIKLKFSMVC